MTNVQVGTIKTEVLIRDTTPSVQVGTEKVEVLAAVSGPAVLVGTQKVETLLQQHTTAQIGNIRTEVLLGNTEVKVGNVTTEVLLGKSQIKVGNVTAEVLLGRTEVQVGTIHTEVLLFHHDTVINFGTITSEVLIRDESPAVQVGNITTEALLFHQDTHIDFGNITTEALLTNDGVLFNFGNITTEVLLEQHFTYVQVGGITTEVLLGNTEVQVGSITSEVLVSLVGQDISFGNIALEVMLQEFVPPPDTPTDRITWDDGDRLYFEGVYKAVLYPQNSPGVAWNGMISVTEVGDDSPASIYVDGQKIRDRIPPSTFAGTITAFTYPEEFEPSIGLIGGMTAQPRQPFGFSYRDNREIHLVYNALVAPSNDLYATVGQDISPVNFSWGFTTIPDDIFEARATSHLVITLDYADERAISDLEDMLYGSATNEPFLPDPSVVLELFESYTTLRITDNLDGTWTADGPDDVITFPTPDTFQIDWPSAIFITADTYRIYSL